MGFPPEISPVHSSDDPSTMLPFNNLTTTSSVKLHMVVQGISWILRCGNMNDLFFAFIAAFKDFNLALIDTKDTSWKRSF